VDTPSSVSRVAGFLGKNTVWAVFWEQAAILSLRVIPNIYRQTFNRDASALQTHENTGNLLNLPSVQAGVWGRFMPGWIYEKSLIHCSNMHLNTVLTPDLRLMIIELMSSA
jgi:hypothetical protein